MKTHIVKFNTKQEQLNFCKSCTPPVATINRETSEMFLNPQSLYYVSSGKIIPNNIYKHYNDFATSIIISDINSFNEVHIYNENSTDEDIIWYFTVPKDFNYDIYDDNKQYLQNVFFEIIDNNLFGKYKLYKSKNLNRNLNIIVVKK